MNNLSEINFVKIEKDDFYKFKDEYNDEILLLDMIEQKFNLIRSKISKNVRNYNNNTFEKIDRKSKFAKSWRIGATIIKKKDVSKFEKMSNEINSLLNNLSPNNFEKITQKILEYLENEDNTKEVLKELIIYTINSIFSKAVLQAVFCPLYVKFLTMIDKKFLVRDLIDQKCNQYENVTNIKKENDTNKLNKQAKYDAFCEEIKDKKFMEGYSQFIGELFKNNIIKYKTLEKSFNMFFMKLDEELEKDSKSQIVEYLIICSVKLFTTIKERLKENQNKNYIEKFKKIQSRDIIKRLKFKIMDLTD